MNLMNKPPMGQKKPKEGKDPARLEAVGNMPCVICREHYERQQSITQVHHCIHGRYGTKRAPDSMTIPLCEGHHQGRHPWISQDRARRFRAMRRPSK